MTDATGVVFKAGPPAKRVVSISPSLTEEIFALGAGDQLVADTIFCRFPEAAQLKPKIGSMLSLSYERILTFHPDLVVAAADGNSAQSVMQLRRLGLRVFVFAESETFASIADHFQQLSNLLGRERAGAAILDQARVEIAAVERRISGEPQVSVFIEIGREPLVSANGDTFVSEIFRDAGGVNCMKNLPGHYPRPSLEAVLSANPDAIFINSTEAAGNQAVSEWERYHNLAAAKSRAIYIVDGHLFATPTPMTFAEAVKAAARLLHPGLR